MKRKLKQKIVQAVLYISFNLLMSALGYAMFLSGMTY